VINGEDRRVHRDHRVRHRVGYHLGTEQQDVQDRQDRKKEQEG
jgi:hypothetical protein